MKPRVPGANHYKAIILHKIWNDVFRWYDASCEVNFVVTLEFHIKDVGVQLHASKAILQLMNIYWYKVFQSVTLM